MLKRFYFLCAALFAGWVMAAGAAGPTFRPDVVFRGNSLTGWTPLGQADWRAENGEIVGTPKVPAGGWLVLGKSFEDVAVFSTVTCPAGCKAGVLVRAEKTPDGGMKGIYVSLTESEAGSFAVTLDAQGRETARTQLQAGGRGGGGGGRAGGARRGQAEVPLVVVVRTPRLADALVRQRAPRARRRPVAVVAAEAVGAAAPRRLVCHLAWSFPDWPDPLERFVLARTLRTSPWPPTT